MQEAEQQVPAKRHHETPLYLGATAGMRLLKYGMHAYANMQHTLNMQHSMLSHGYWVDCIPSVTATV